MNRSEARRPDRPALPEDRFLFLHIESTGGTTVGALLHRLLGADVVTTPIGSTMTAEEAHRTFGPATFEGHRVVVGHYDASVVPAVPGLRTLTVLRDPVDRLRSTYRRYRRSTDMGSEFWHEEIRRGDLDLLGFARHPYAPYALTETQTRQLAGAMWGGVDPRTPRDELAEMARETLGSLAWLGILERFGESLVALARLFDVAPISEVEHLNAAPGDGIEALDPDLRAELEHLCELDRDLYRRAVALFERRSTPTGATSSL